LAREVEGIDLIVGGHSHSLLETPDIQNKTPIVQVQDNGKYLGRVDLEFINGRTLVKKYEAISINKKDDIVRLAPDKKVLELLRPYYEKGNKYLLKEIGDTDEDFVGERDIVRTQSTNLGQLITYAYREVYQADVAIVNSGGIRSSLKKGKITYEDVLKVLPFGGEVVLAELMGNELRDYLEFVLINMLPLSGGFPQLIGAEAIVDPVIKKLSKLLINGESIMSEKKYKIALPEFLALGGDHYPKINAKRYGKIDSIILKDYIAKKKHLTSADFSLKNQSTAK
jgi:5'-nucleotidase/UDP-sugar diphosphatase